MNNIVIAGRITADAKAIELASGDSLIEFSIAVNRKVKDTENTIFFEVKAWGKQGILPYLTKGKFLMVQGRIDEKSWETDGVKRSKMFVVANDIQFGPSTKEEA